MKILKNTNNYSAYIDSIKSIVKQEAADKNRLAELQKLTHLEESRLQNHVQHLRHLKELQQKEFQQWQSRVQELTSHQKLLEQQIENQSKNLAFSKAQLEHGLRMINLLPNSTAEDYLANTTLHKSSEENLRGDWGKVGEQLAQSFFYNEKDESNS